MTISENFHPLCGPGGAGLCAFRFSAAAFLFARALRFLSLSVVGPPRASRRSLSLRKKTSLLPHWSFPVRKKVFFVRYEVQRFPAQKWYASKDEIDWSKEDSKIAYWIERLTALGVSGIKWPSSLLPPLLPIEKNLFPNIFHDAASVSEHRASARTSGQSVSFCSVLFSAGAGTPCNLIAFKRSVCFPHCQLHHSLSAIQTSGGVVPLFHSFWLASSGIFHALHASLKLQSKNWT